ncbi:MAG: DUF493 family protein [Gilvibacter sp.]
MSDAKKTEEFYARLKTQLEDSFAWPSLYLFKFIVPTNPDKIKAFSEIFANTDATINNRESSKGTYTSVSVKTTMESPQAVIDKYLEVSNIEGVISL